MKTKPEDFIRFTKKGRKICDKRSILSMDPEAIRAYHCYDKQKDRCYNKRSKSYLNYGGKGLTVEYTREEFISWWMNNIKGFYGENPSVGRIDHSKGYSFDNIKIESTKENAIERFERVGVPNGNLKRVAVFDFKSASLLMLCRSARHAEKTFGDHVWSIHSQCKKGPRNSKRGFSYMYYEDAI